MCYTYFNSKDNLFRDGHKKRSKGYLKVSPPCKNGGLVKIYSKYHMNRAKTFIYFVFQIIITKTKL